MVTFTWPSNDSSRSNQWRHLMAPFKLYNFCLKHFFLKCIVYEIFDLSGTFWTPCIIYNKMKETIYICALLLYLKKIRRPPSPEILHTSSMLPTDSTPSTRIVKRPPTVTENCIVSVHTTAFKPPCTWQQNELQIWDNLKFSAKFFTFLFHFQT